MDGREKAEYRKLRKCLLKKCKNHKFCVVLFFKKTYNNMLFRDGLCWHVYSLGFSIIISMWCTLITHSFVGFCPSLEQQMFNLGNSPPLLSSSQQHGVNYHRRDTKFCLCGEGGGGAIDCISSPAGRSLTDVSCHSFSDFSRALNNIQWLSIYPLFLVSSVEGLL